MSHAEKLRFEPKLVIDHTSAQGPRAVSVRGSIIIGSLRLLRDSGHFPTYEAHLPSEHREAIVFAMAGSWLPAELLRVHFATVDSLNLSDVQLSRIGETVGAQIIDSLFGSLVRAARQAGAEAGPWIALRQIDRIWDRIMQGGGVTVVQTGPKDATLEVFGVPIAGSRFFRISHSAFVRGAMLLATKACFVKPIAPRRASAEAFTVSLSWV